MRDSEAEHIQQSSVTFQVTQGFEGEKAVSVEKVTGGAILWESSRKMTDSGCRAVWQVEMCPPEICLLKPNTQNHITGPYLE